MIGAILKGTNSSFQKGMTFCRSIYVKKVMKLLAFIFEQPSYGFRMCQLSYLYYFHISLNYILINDIPFLVILYRKAVLW